MDPEFFHTSGVKVHSMPFVAGPNWAVYGYPTRPRDATLMAKVGKVLGVPVTTHTCPG
jgi:hypothetical protein